MIVRKKGKTKVYELSRTLKMKEAELIPILLNLEIEVSTKFSPISDEDIDRVKDWCAQHKKPEMVGKQVVSIVRRRRRKKVVSKTTVETMNTDGTVEVQETLYETLEVKDDLPAASDEVDVFSEHSVAEDDHIQLSCTKAKKIRSQEKTNKNGGVEGASICTKKKESRSMKYNPFTEEYNRQQHVIDGKKSKLRTLTDKLYWYEKTDISNLHNSLKGKVSSKDTLQSRANLIEKEIEVLQTSIQETEQHVKTLFNPFNWFDGDQKAHRNRLQELKKALDSKKENIKQIQKSITETDRSIREIQNDIATHKDFDRSKVSGEISSLGKEIDLLGEEFNQISDLKNRVDTELRPILKQVNNYEQEITASEEIIRKAQSLEKKLDCAENTYERAMVHQECENSFNEGSPKKIIRQQERIIRQAQRDLEKAKKRANLIGNKAVRDIRKIVIDGNNLCYEDDNFVGLDPVISTTIELQKKYNVIVVFDSAIRSQVNENDQIIRERFSDNVKVHIVAVDRLADETILDIASSDDHCFILSNDRFGEYREKEVVKNNRLIKHEIVDGRVIIHDLNVNVRFG